jgi:hypothetical protein
MQPPRRHPLPGSTRRLHAAAGTLLVVAFAAIGALVGAAEWIVDDDGPADFTRIQSAINAPYVLSGDTIRVRPGVYLETIYLGSKDLSVVSEAGPFLTIIDAQRMGSVVSLLNRSPATLIEGFTLRNGQDQTGGGVFIYGGGPIVRRNVIAGNSAVGSYLGYGYGGGVEVVESAPVIRQNVIYGNTALDGGGGIDVYYSGPSTPGTCCPLIAGNTVVGNHVTSATGIGGGILVSAAEPRIVSGIVSGNEAAAGGGLYVEKLQGIPDAPDVSANILFGNIPDNVDASGAYHLPASNRIADPRLGPGPWMDWWPRSDSPAIDAAGADPPFAADLTGLSAPADGDLDGTSAGDIGAVENRGEITGLMVATVPGRPGDAALTWDASINPSATFTVRASDGDPFRTGAGFCLATGLNVSAFTDSAALPPGVVRYYLVVGADAVAGSMGFRSDGSPRAVAGGCAGP